MKIRRGCPQKQKNETLAALFLFQYSLVIPLEPIINISFAVAAFGVLIIFLMMLFNKKQVINVKSCLVVAFIVVFMLLKYFIDQTSIEVPINFLLIALPPIIIFSYHIDWALFLQKCYILSDITFLALFWLPFFVKVTYMRFGYGILPTVIFSALYLGQNKEASAPSKIVKWVILLVSLVEMIIYGARGALLCFGLFMLVYVVLVRKSSKLIILGTVVALVIMANLEKIVIVLTDFASLFGVKSYALRKITLMLNEGLEVSASGRFELYRAALNDIKANPFLGKTIEPFSSDELYVHNLFLQVGVDLGVIAMILLAIFIFYTLALMARRRKTPCDYKIVLAVVFAISVGRLFISSNLWERPEFWILLCIAFQKPKHASEDITFNNG